jgi:hypothetical protein
VEASLSREEENPLLQTGILLAELLDQQVSLCLGFLLWVIISG